jgi:hypothetical protein
VASILMKRETMFIIISIPTAFYPIKERLLWH